MSNRSIPAFSLKSQACISNCDSPVTRIVNSRCHSNVPIINGNCFLMLCSKVNKVCMRKSHLGNTFSFWIVQKQWYIGVNRRSLIIIISTRLQRTKNKEQKTKNNTHPKQYYFLYQCLHQNASRHWLKAHLISCLLQWRVSSPRPHQYSHCPIDLCSLGGYLNVLRRKKLQSWT